jgi:riboflavin-specific deaminase-like protein
VALERLLPDPGSVDPAEAYADLRLGERARADRPYVIANMVATVDGRATLGGRTETISSATDRELFLGLRTQVDAVMAGPATIGLERYGPLVRSPERRSLRRTAGLDEVPLAVTVTRTMELPVQAPLFQDAGARIVVLTNSDREAPATEADVTVERLPGDDLDLVAAMEALRLRHGVRSVLMEGGPTLLGAMLGAGLVDELFLTRSPLIVGGGGEVTIVEGEPLPEPPRLTIVSVLRDESFFFLRYRVGA